MKAALTIVEPNGKVMYQGDEVAAVAAATEEQARDALRLIKVQYDVLAHIATEALALRPDAPAVFEGGNIKEGNTDETGDLDAGFKAAAEIVEATYQTQVQTHVCLETHGCVCEWEGDKLTAWVSTQAVHGTREGFAESLQIPQANIRVICEYMGGGFGSKFGPDVQGVVCAKLAKAGRCGRQADARSEGRTSGGGEPPLVGLEDQGRRRSGWHAHRVRRRVVRHGRRECRCRIPAAVHLHVPEPPSQASGRVHERRTRTRHARSRDIRRAASRPSS